MLSQRRKVAVRGNRDHRLPGPSFTGWYGQHWRNYSQSYHTTDEHALRGKPVTALGGEGKVGYRDSLHSRQRERVRARKGRASDACNSLTKPR